MIQVKDSLLSHHQLRDFSVLVLHHVVVVVLLLTQSCGGQSQVIGPALPVVAMIGDDMVLPCQLDPPVDTVDLTVEWSRLDLNPRFVHLRRDGLNLLAEQNPLYAGRTSLSINKLKCGDVSLKLSAVKLSDAGKYKCLVPTFKAESEFELAVGSVSSPYIKISKIQNGVELQCESAGWYPEPEVLWLDGEGNLLPAGPTETLRGPDDLYTVSSRVTVDKRHSNNITCRVQQNDINQTSETHILISDDLFVVQSNPAVRIAIILFCFMSTAAVIIFVWKRGKNKTKTKKQKHKDETELKSMKTRNINDDVELQLLIEGQKGKEQLMTGSEKIKQLYAIKAKLGELLQKNEEELQQVQHVIKTLTDQKKDLKNQMEKLKSLQQEDNTQITVIEKKEEEKFRGKTKKRTKTKADVTKRQTDHEKLLETTEKLLEKTEEMILMMTVRKVKLEEDKKQLSKHLKETEDEGEEIQRSERQEGNNDQSTKDQCTQNPNEMETARKQMKEGEVHES